CGGGLFAEELARLGASVIGVDPSAPSLETARAHAEAAGLAIDYRLGSGEQLPLPDASADIACCVDVLEHVSDVPAVLRETARILKPGGVYLYDTINRTPLSRLIVIKLSQEWGPTAWAPRDLHHYSQFITPAELASLLEASGLSDGGHTGIKPSAGPPRILRLLRQAKTGKISYAEFGRRLEFVLTNGTQISYIGHAVKKLPPTPGQPPRTSAGSYHDPPRRRREQATAATADSDRSRRLQRRESASSLPTACQPARPGPFGGDVCGRRWA
ncbi:MAG: 3-demethylubiquinone-9 3-O-methyltransferase, partial [Actinomycetia bacterium]|nr:3-demethylubiquinone-9 3-O-methyltransferase [Actinomycetes bacterium]